MRNGRKQRTLQLEAQHRKADLCTRRHTSPSVGRRCPRWSNRTARPLPITARLRKGRRVADSSNRWTSPPGGGDRRRRPRLRACRVRGRAARVRAGRLRRPRAARRGRRLRLDARDRALAMRLAYGAVQRRRDARPRDRDARRAPRRAARARRARRAAARASSSSLFLDRVPAARRGRRVASSSPSADAPRGAGLVNAVLRRAAREAPRAASPRCRDDTPARGRAAPLAPRLDRASCGGTRSAPTTRAR